VPVEISAVDFNSRINTGVTMFVDAAIQRDMISFRKDWARWSAGERIFAKITLLLTLAATMMYIF